jgi:hypothetical protein
MKTNWLMLFKEIIAVYTEIHINAELLNLKWSIHASKSLSFCNFYQKATEQENVCL